MLQGKNNLRVLAACREGGSLYPGQDLALARPHGRPPPSAPLSRPASQQHHLQLLVVLVCKVEESSRVEEELG